MASTAIANVSMRPLSGPVGSIMALKTTNASTSSTATGRTIGLGHAVLAVSAQAIVSTGTATITVEGSLASSGGWTTLKSTSWTSTQAGVVRSIVGASTSAKPVTHLRARITDMSTAPGAGGADVTVWLAVI